MIFKMLGTKWCEALSSDFSFRGALRVVLDRGVKFGIFSHSSEKSEDSAHSNGRRKNIHFCFDSEDLILESVRNALQNAWNQIVNV